MILEIPREKISTLLEKDTALSSEELRKQVVQARNIQQERFKNSDIQANAYMRAKDINYYINLDQSCKDLINTAAHRLNLSGRLIHRLIKLARTIADMQGDSSISTGHLMEALNYRSKTMFVENEG